MNVVFAKMEIYSFYLNNVKQVMVNYFSDFNRDERFLTNTNVIDCGEHTTLKQSIRAYAERLKMFKATRYQIHHNCSE
jgi:hypothetical protein